MSLYYRMRDMINRRRVSATARGFASRESVYMRSGLLRRLASEMGHDPQPPASFVSSLEDREKQARARNDEWRRLRERREELTAEADEQERVLHGATSFTPLDEIVSARQRLEAAMYLLSLTPEPEEEEPEDAGHEALFEGVRVWLERLRRERVRTREEVEGLERGGEVIDLDRGEGRAASLLEELDAVTEAEGHAEECLRVPVGREERRWSRFSGETPKRKVGGS